MGDKGGGGEDGGCSLDLTLFCIRKPVEGLSDKHNCLLIERGLLKCAGFFFFVVTVERCKTCFFSF